LESPVWWPPDWQDLTGATVKSFRVDFTYDDRGRLIGETRTDISDSQNPVVLYDIEYAYDQLGNRLSKKEWIAQRRTEYHYDVQYDPNQLPFPTHHNRLLDYEVSTMDPNGQPVDLLRTVDYTYYKTGQASNVTVKDEYVAGVTPGDRKGGSGVPPESGSEHDLAASVGQDARPTRSHGPLKRALWGRWDDSGEEGVVYEADLAREFRYDDPRARYIVADFDPNDPTRPGRWTAFGDALLTDHDGVSPYLDGDLDLDTYGYSASRSHFGTAGHADVASGAEAYYHGDLIDSTMLTTDSGGAGILPAVAYTAFGEPAAGASAPSALDTRYQYAGGWGYESGLLGLQGANTALAALTFQHLGWRWYDPSTGRFIQRDPIGLRGGWNVYVCCNSDLVDCVDPEGTASTWTGEVLGWLGAAGGAIICSGLVGLATKNPKAAVGAGAFGAAAGYSLCSSYGDWLVTPPPPPPPLPPLKEQIKRAYEDYVPPGAEQFRGLVW
jgi:RHS repeat-associated protein